MNSPLQLRKKADYYSLPLISNSGLSQFYAKLFELPAFSVSAATLRKGQLVHQATYEEGEFHCCPEFTAYCKKEADGKTESLIWEVERLAAIARSSPIIAFYLKHKLAQFEVDWFALIDGVPVKVKPDAMIPNHLNDLKTTACQSRDEFISYFDEYGYFRQAAMYLEATGCKNFTFLGVSKTRLGNTFLVDVKDFKKQMKDAREEVHERIRLYVKHNPKYIQESLKLFKRENLKHNNPTLIKS